MVPRLEPTLDLSRQGIRLAEDARDSTKEKPRFSIGWARTECCGVRPPSCLVCENRKWHRNGNMFVCQAPNVFLYVNIMCARCTLRCYLHPSAVTNRGSSLFLSRLPSFLLPLLPLFFGAVVTLLPHPVLSVFLVSPFSFALAQNPSWIGVESRRRILCQPCRNFLTGPGTASAVQKVRQGGRQTSPPIFSGKPGRILRERKGKQSRKEIDSTGFGCARGPTTGALDDFQKGYKTAHESVPTPPLES